MTANPDAEAGTRLSPPIRRPWIVACLTGELAGFVPPAVAGAGLVLLDAPEPVLVVGLVIAGVFEGLILGSAQATVVERALPGVSGWARATGLAAGLAWLAGMGGSSLLQATGAVALAIAIPGWVVGLLAMGVLQAQRLASVVDATSRWVWITTLAWLVAVPIPVVALSVIPNNWPMWIHVVVGVIAAVAMGGVVGAVSAGTLQRFIDAQRSPMAPRHLATATSERQPTR